MKYRLTALIISAMLIFCTACSQNGADTAVAANAYGNEQSAVSEMITETEISLTSPKKSDTDTESEYRLTEKEQAAVNDMRAYMQDLDFSGTVLLGVGDNIIYCDSYGYSDSKAKIKNQNDTVYQIASLTKQFTGAAILLLQEQGKLNVTDKLSKYISGYKYADKLTIENLLFMTSGLQDFADAYILDELDETKEYRSGEIFDLVKDYDLWNTPGKVYEYCNTNYYLLGMIIEKASGQTYEEYVTENIFKPLGMTFTSLDNSTVTAKGYSWGKEYERVYNKTVFNSAGAICSNAYDMFKWLNGFYGNKIISRDSIKYILSDKSKLGYSCGWVVSQKGIMRHSGNLGGYKTFSLIDYENDIKVIVLSNNEQQLSAEIGLQLDNIAKTHLK